MSFNFNFNCTDRVEFNTLVGKTLTRVEDETGLDLSTDPYDRPEEVILTCASGEKFAMHHESSCCEYVRLEEIVGDLKFILNEEILVAEETSNSDRSNQEDEDLYSDSATWTFYTIRTMSGTVVFRWLGTSNGCYSEAVWLYKESNEDLAG